MTNLRIYHTTPHHTTPHHTSMHGHYSTMGSYTTPPVTLTLTLSTLTLTHWPALTVDRILDLCLSLPVADPQRWLSMREVRTCVCE
jgi:hypothetical protein